MAHLVLTSEDLWQAPVKGDLAVLIRDFFAQLHTDGSQSSGGKMCIYRAFSTEMRPLIQDYISISGVTPDPLRTQILTVSAWVESQALRVLFALSALREQYNISRSVTDLLEEQLDDTNPVTTVAVVCCICILAAWKASRIESAAQ